MFNIGAGELAVILVVALLVLGPKRLPELARGLGKVLREFRRQTDEVRSVVEREFYRMDQDDAAKAPPRPMPAPKPLSRPLSLPYRVPELRQTIGAAGPALAAVSTPDDAAKAAAPAAESGPGAVQDVAPEVAAPVETPAAAVEGSSEGDKPAADAAPSDPNELLH